MAASSIPIRDTSDGATFRIRVVPRASRSEAAGIQGDALKLWVTAAPTEGKANDECIRLLAKILGVKKAQVTIIAGHTARTKTVAVEGVRAGSVAAILSRS
ncbi:MAG: hypothetical protein A3J94_07120 [Syntrophus sp. RIFOXYC2_FULL_54_9]|nr:MAG: hypothetical protein A2X92_00805 [Syntrophus sp. GWC2_56_31]OHE25871.1 MAG: hypothetical protein A3J94_07120 [Syntrophus sp. RIFOXYC2_FULL_54_9]HBB15718.1 hypothetical protein [Syntrophus sp. (in: bacteria)]